MLKKKWVFKNLKLNKEREKKEEEEKKRKTPQNCKGQHRGRGL